MRLTLKSIAMSLSGLCILASFNASAASRHDEGIGLYVGYDGLATIASGTYAGLSNPNPNCLIFLLDHGNYFHGIGVYRYTGPGGST